MVMEKSWNMNNWPKVMECCDSVKELYQFCTQFVLNLYFFGQNVANSKSGREMVMENLEIVMEKS